MYYNFTAHLNPENMSGLLVEPGLSFHHLLKFMVNHDFFRVRLGKVCKHADSMCTEKNGTWKQPSLSSLPSTSFAQTSDGLLKQKGTVDGSEILALS